jgi:hypothetical protein
MSLAWFVGTPLFFEDSKSEPRDSTYYVGEMTDAFQRHGLGYTSYSNGDVFRGRWENDRLVEMIETMVWPKMC